MITVSVFRNHLPADPPVRRFRRGYGPDGHNSYVVSLASKALSSVLVATDDGISRRALDDSASTTVLAGRSVRQVERGAASEEYSAATGTGLFRSGDGEEWVETGVTTADSTHVDAVVSVHETANGQLFAGTTPAHLYRSPDGGGDVGSGRSLRRDPRHGRVDPELHGTCPLNCRTRW